MTRAFSVALLATVVLLGCAPKRAALRTISPPPPSKPRSPANGTLLSSSLADLAPGASPGERANLRLGAPPKDGRNAPTAMEFEVAIRRKTEGDETALRLLAEKETIERENYESLPESFRLVSTGEDAFVPPLDAIRFPARQGDAWSWKGRVVYAGISRAARAEVALSRDGGDVRSEVALVVAAPGGPERHRTLVFFFRKGQGVVARSFGDVSARWPLEESWRP